MLYFNSTNGYHTFFIALSWFYDRAQYMNYF